jgi:hypothetical protein
MWPIHIEIHGALDRKQIVFHIHTGKLNKNISVSPFVPNLTILIITMIYNCYVQKDMTNFRLKLAVTLVNYPWNTVQGSPGWKPSDIEEKYTPEENEKKK